MQLEAFCVSRRMPRLIFVHLPKTGGTTLRKIIEREFEPGEIYDFYNGPEQKLEALRGLGPEERERFRVLLGHVDCAEHDPIEGEAVYVTLLRDPVERVLSMYRHQSMFPTNEAFARIKAEGLGLREFMSELRMPRTNNCQTRMLSGIRDVPFGACTREMLGRARQNIRERFALVMLTERFDESMVLLRRMFGWKSPCYLPENVSTNRSPRSEVPPDVIELIEHHNRLDIELYRDAEELFGQMVALQGASFRRELEEFRQINECASRWLTREVVWEAR